MRWARALVLLFAAGAGCSGPAAPRDLEAPVVPPEPSAALSVEPLSALPPVGERASARLAFPYLRGEPQTASVSIGDTTHGRLVNGRSLEESDSLKILPKQKERDLRYGTSELVKLLDAAGRTLFEKTKTPLWVGNLGRLEGGDIEWSVSHNAGRDADVAFCYQDPVTKRPIDPPDLVAIGKNGLSADNRFAFDTARTWLVVRSMLELEGVSLQYLFISDPLKKKLLEHARSIGEPAKLIERANEIVRQPGGAAAHDDHLHVRVYCSAFDAGGGCRDIGYVHPYAKLHDGERDKTAARAREQATDSDANVRRAALLRLGLVGGPADVALGLAHLNDAAPEARVAACELVAALGDEKSTSALVQRFREETDPAASAALVQAVGALGGADAGPFLRDVLLASTEAPPLFAGESPACIFDVPTDPAPEGYLLLAPRPIADAVLDRRGLQRLAVRASRFADRLEPVAPLVSLLDPADPVLGELAAESLAYITNQRLFDDTVTRPVATRLADAQRMYGGVLSGLGSKAPRDSWLVRGFSMRGYKIGSLDRRAAWELLRAAADEPHLAYNARRALGRMLDQPTSVVHFGAGDGCRWLHSLLWDRRRELRLDRPSEAQLSACWRARSREKAAQQSGDD